MAQSTSDWIKQLAAQQRASGVAATKEPKYNLNALGGSSSSSSTAPAKKHQSALGWMFDMLSRPLHAIEGAQQAGVKAENKIQNDIADHKRGNGNGNFGQALANTFEPVGAGIEGGIDGLLGKKPKTSGAGVIQDVANYYGNESQNKQGAARHATKVNPIVKGVGGFALDLAEDPTSYIPGPDVVKGARTLKGAVDLAKAGGVAEKGVVATLKDAKSGVEAADAAKAAARAAKKAAKKAPVAEEIPTPVVESAADVTPTEVTPAVTPPTKFIKAQIDAAPKAAAKAEQVAAKVASKPAAVVDTARAPKMLDFIKSLAPAEAKTTTKMLTDVSAAKPLAEDAFHAELSGAGKEIPQMASGTVASHISTIVNDTANIPARDAAMTEALRDPGFKKFASAKFPFEGKTMTAGDAIKEIAGKRIVGTPSPRTQKLAGILNTLQQRAAVSDDAAKAGAYQKYVDAFTKAQGNGKLINAVGEDVTQAAPGSVTETLTNQMQNFQDKLTANRQSIEDSLGEGTVKSLEGIVDPKKFDNAIEQMNRVIADGVYRPQPDSQAAKQVATQLGILKPKASIVDTPALAKTPEDVVAPVDPAAPPKEKVQVQATAAAAAAGLDPRVQADVAEAAKDTLEHVGPALSATREAGNDVQYGMVKAMQKSVDRDALTKADGTRLLNVAASQQRMATFLSRYTPLRMAIEKAGFPAVMGEGDQRLALGFDELLTTLDKADPLVAAFHFNATGAVAPTNMMDLAVAVTNGERDPAILEAIVRRVVRDADGNGKNPIVKSERALIGSAKGARGGAFSQNELVQRNIAAFIKAAPELSSISERNASEIAARASTESRQLGGTAIAELKSIMDEGTTDDQVKSLLGIGDGLKKGQQQLQTLDESRQLAETMTKGAVPDTTLKEAQKLDETAKAVGKAATKPRLAIPDVVDEISQQAAKPQREKAEAEFQSLADQQGAYINMDDMQDAKLAAGMWGKTPILGGFLAAMKHDLGAPVLGYVGSQAAQVSHTVLALVAKNLNGISKQFAPDVLKDAHKMLANGLESSEPEMQQAMAALKGEYDKLHGGGDALLNTSYWRTGTNIFRLNDILARKGTGIQFDMERAAREAKENGTSLAQAVSDQWKDHGADDPVQYIMSMHNAIQQSNTEQAIAHTFETTMREHGLTSTVPKQDYVRLLAPKAESILQKYLTPGMYYHKALAQEYRAVDSMMRESTRIDGKLGDFLDKTVKPSMNLWKTGMTILRPGHHIRNNIGDASSTYLALGHFGPQWFKKAIQVQASHNSYDAWDAIKALQSAGQYAIPTTGDKIMTVALKGGKKIELSSDGLFHSATNEGLMPNYHASENLEQADNGGNRIFNALTENKATHFAGSVAEAGSHMQNLTHFLVYMNKNSSKFDSLPELMEAAGRDVRKWHLGGTMLRGAEKKYGRLLIPFYSWSRMAIPLVAESVLTHPGRVMAFPKAQYALATANGVNPNSLSDPFPDDQLFPQWMTDEENGPVTKIDGNYYSIAPGFTSQDLLSTYAGSNPVDSIAGSLTPWIKDPIELKTGVSLQTGAPIKTGEYIDNQIPGVNWVDSLTGISPTNSVLNGKVTQTAAVAAGNKDPKSPVGVLNFLTGLGITNDSQPNYIKEAQYEQQGKN